MKQFNIFKKLCLPVLAICAASGGASAAVTSGTYTVGTGGTYATLAAAVTDLNSSTITGAVTFNILPGTYTTAADWQVIVGAVSGASATNRITFQAQTPGTVTINVAGTNTANYVIKLDGASYVDIKNLVLVNSGTSYGRVVELAGAASYDSIVRCRLTGVSTSSSSNDRAVIYANNTGSMISNVIKADTIQNGSHGIYWWSPSTNSVTHTFSNNVISGSREAYLYARTLSNPTITGNICSASGVGTHYGFYIPYTQNGHTFTNNSITTSGSGEVHGLYETYSNSSSANNELVVSNNTINLTAGGYVYGVNFNNYNKRLRITNNTINTSTTSGDNYGAYLYWFNENIYFNNNTVTCLNSSSYYYTYALYNYYNNYNISGAAIEVNNNTVTATYSNGTYGNYGMFNYFLNYYNTNSTFQMNNNTVNVNTTSSAGYYNYDHYAYYINYGTGNTTEIKGNTSNLNSGYLAYAWQLMYLFNATVENNTINNQFNQSSGYAYIYGAYYSDGIKFRNNAYNTNMTVGGTIYNYAFADYHSGSGTQDTIENNTQNFNLTSATYYTYQYYANGVNRNNTLNVNTTSGTIYHSPRYSYSGKLYNNKINLTSTTGAIYGFYCYGGTSYSADYIANTWNMNSNTGNIYAFGGYYGGGNKLFGNVFSAKTAGSTYMIYESSGLYADDQMVNNTFHSNSTGSTNYLVYRSGNSSSYNGKHYVYNNIFSKSNGASTHPAVYIADTTYWMADYNLYYTPGTVNLQRTSGSAITTSSLQAWRNNTKRDLNSLIYDPGYLDAANRDFRPDPANSNAWAAHGRGRHIAGDTLDAAMTARPRTVTQGVPDLGAYEFTPTSTPPAAIATPATPVPGGTQVFTFGQDTVQAIKWGVSAPSAIVVRQYSGVQAPVVPGTVDRMYFYTTMDAGGAHAFPHSPMIYYKDPQLGTIPNETAAKIAKSSNGGLWQGYNFSNGITDSIRNILTSKNEMDSIGSYSGVLNARIGIRCVVPPSNVEHDNVTAFAADMSWDTVFNPIGYQLIYTTSKGTPTSGAGALFLTSSSTTLTGLLENTTYYVYVRTICGSKDTSDWAVDSFRTLITCHKPDVKITALTNSRAIAYWDPVLTSYKYEYAVTNSPAPPAFGTTIYTNQIQVPLQPGQKYWVHVRAYCNTMYTESDWGNAAFETFPTSVSNVNINSIGLEAYPNPVKDILNVKLYNKIDGTATLTLTDVTGKTIKQVSVTDTKVELDMNGIAPGMYQLKYTDRSHIDVIKINKQ